MQLSSLDIVKRIKMSLVTYNKFYDWITVGYLEQINIKRPQNRIVVTNEHFTSLENVLLSLELFPKERFEDCSTIWRDSNAGEGIWLCGVALKRMEFGFSHKEAVRNLQSIELMEDNCKAIIIRLMCNDESLRPMLEKNIVCADALRYHYRFDGTDPYKTGQDIHNESLFEIT